MRLESCFSGFIDFLFPKASLTYELESLEPGELLAELPPPSDQTGAAQDTIALFSYADRRVRELVWELKYRRNARIVASLATILYDVLKAELSERALTENFRDPLLLPMPMHEKRRLARGWNQTEVLSLEISKLDGENILEYRPDILERVLHAESQTRVSKAERLRNVQGSMRATAEARGRSIVLVDDVTTTGATFKEARRALRQAGALKILCVSVAH